MHSPVWRLTSRNKAMVEQCICALTVPLNCQCNLSPFECEMDICDSHTNIQANINFEQKNVVGWYERVRMCVGGRMTFQYVEGSVMLCFAFYCTQNTRCHSFALSFDAVRGIQHSVEFDFEAIDFNCIKLDYKIHKIQDQQTNK